MNNKILIFLAAVLLLGGVFVLVNNQKKMTAVKQGEPAMEKNDEGKMEETVGDEKEDTLDNSDKDTERVKVSVTDTGFEPQTVTVDAGTKVVWENATTETANVSSANHPTHLVYPPLNLGNFEPGKTVKLVFKEPGEYKYHDHLHPTKFGTVVVK